MEEFEATYFQLVNASEYDQRAFIDYFSGIMLDDIASVNEAAQRLADLNTPFADELPRRAIMYEDFQLNGAYDSSTLEIVSGWSLRAYVYSGVPVDRNMVLMVANKAGFSKKELRSWLLPCATLIDGVIDGYGEECLDDQDKAILKWRGLKALRDIGIDSFSDKVRMAAHSKFIKLVYRQG